MLYDGNGFTVEGSQVDNYCLIKITGIVKGDEFVIQAFHNIDSYIELSILKGYPNRIADFSTATMEIDSELILELANKSNHLYQKYPNSKSAIVADTPEMFGGSKVYDGVHDFMTENRKVFKELTKAIAWIKNS